MKKCEICGNKLGLILFKERNVCQQGDCCVKLMRKLKGISSPRENAPVCWRENEKTRKKYVERGSKYNKTCSICGTKISVYLCRKGNVCNACSGRNRAGRTIGVKNI